MQRGESAVSIAVAAVVLMAVIAIHSRWQLASLREIASSAEEFILTTTGLRGQIPEIAGYERVNTYPLGAYQAALYRASPAPLIFAPGLFVIYDRDKKPVFKLETLEGSKEPWTVVYDFAGKEGATVRRSRSRPRYTRPLPGTNVSHAIIGQYSGGDHCCTTATIVELGTEKVRAAGRIDRLNGLPFEGLELRNLDKDTALEFIAHRPYRTLCGGHEDSADVITIYDFVDGRYSDQTQRHATFLQDLLRKNLDKWSKGKEQSLQLLQTLATDYARLGQPEQGKRFFAMNLPAIVQEVEKRGVDPNACIEEVELLVNRTASIEQ